MAKQTKEAVITYDWNCKTVDVYPKDGEFTDVVYNVHWIVVGSDDSETPLQASAYGTQVLNTSDITDFKPFDQLTNEEVVAWTKSTMGEEAVLELEVNIANQIALLINPTSITMTIEN
jgi:hypothetical protein